MEWRGILGVVAIGVGLFAFASGLLLLVTWPYWVDVLAVVGGPAIVVVGIVLLRREGRHRD